MGATSRCFSKLVFAWGEGTSFDAMGCYPATVVGRGEATSPLCRGPRADGGGVILGAGPHGLRSGSGEESSIGDRRSS